MMTIDEALNIVESDNEVYISPTDGKVLIDGKCSIELLEAI
jgi:hypothetical protein